LQHHIRCLIEYLNIDLKIIETASPPDFTQKIAIMPSMLDEKSHIRFIPSQSTPKAPEKTPEQEISWPALSSDLLPTVYELDWKITDLDIRAKGYLRFLETAFQRISFLDRKTFLGVSDEDMSVLELNVLAYQRFVEAPLNDLKAVVTFLVSRKGLAHYLTVVSGGDSALCVPVVVAMNKAGAIETYFSLRRQVDRRFKGCSFEAMGAKYATLPAHLKLLWPQLSVLMVAFPMLGARVFTPVLK